MLGGGSEGDIVNCIMPRQVEIEIGGIGGGCCCPVPEIPQVGLTPDRLVDEISCKRTAVPVIHREVCNGPGVDIDILLHRIKAAKSGGGDHGDPVGYNVTGLIIKNMADGGEGICIDDRVISHFPVIRIAIQTGIYKGNLKECAIDDPVGFEPGYGLGMDGDIGSNFIGTIELGGRKQVRCPGDGAAGEIGKGVHRVICLAGGTVSEIPGKGVSPAGQV